MAEKKYASTAAITELWANTKAYTPNEASDADVAEMLEELGLDGIDITDGIVIKAKDANGYPTEVDVYGDITPFMFSFSQAGYNQHSGWEYLTTINIKTDGCSMHAGCMAWLTNLTTINGAEKVSAIYGPPNGGAGTFNRTNSMTEYNFPNAIFPEQTIGRRIFANCAVLENIYLPKASGAFNGGYFIIQNCPSLKNVQMGSIGHSVTTIGTYAFQGCAQTDLTITIYSTGDNADNIVSAIRSHATGATIIIKASEATTYNGTSYAAGDTMLTSEVTS